MTIALFQYKVQHLSALLLLLLLSTAGTGQRAGQLEALVSSQEPIDSSCSQWFSHSGIGISAGTKSLIAADFIMAIKGRWNIRLGYNWMNPQLNPWITDLQGAFDSDVSIEFGIQHTSVELLTDIGFFRGKMRLTGGLSYSFDNILETTVRFVEDYQLNDVLIPAEEVGAISGRLRYQSNWAGYLGIGFGPSIPRKSIAMNLDLGLYMKGIPLIDILATGIFRSNEENEAAINNVLRSDVFYRLWPVAQLRLVVKLF